MFTMPRTFLVLAGLLLGLAVEQPALAQAAGFEPDLLFHSMRHGASQIYLANSSSGAIQRLRVGTDEDIDATWSPDGRQILFVSRHGTNSDVYLADANGANARALTDHPSFDGGARWSPDGKAIAFISGRSGAAKAFLMAPDGSNQRRLTDLVEGDEASLSWSADGKRIAFVRIINRKMTVWTASVDGSAMPTRLTNSDAGSETNPMFAPSGNELVYISSRRGKSAMWLTNLDTGASRALGEALNSVSVPNWTADGKHIVVEGRLTAEPRSDVFMVSVASGEAVNLSNHPAEDLGALMSPAGDRLAFVSYRDSPVGQVYVQDIKSGALRRLGEAGKHEFRPVWRPGSIPGKGGAPAIAGAG